MTKSNRVKYYIIPFIISILPVNVRALDDNFAAKNQTVNNYEYVDKNRKLDLKEVKITRIEPFKTNSVKLTKLISLKNETLESSIESYNFPHTENFVVLDKQNLENKQWQTKRLYQFVPYRKISFLEKCRRGRKLLNAAQYYYEENKIQTNLAYSSKKKFKNFYLTTPPTLFSSNHVPALRMGKFCENEATRLLQSEFNYYSLPIKDLSLSLPNSTLFINEVSYFIPIYSKLELYYFLNKEVVNFEKSFSQRLLNELETLPLFNDTFDESLNFLDFNYIWLKAPNQYSSVKVKRIIKKASKCFDVNIVPKKTIFQTILKFRIKDFKKIKDFKIPTKREVRDACVDGIAKFFKFKRWMHKNVQRPLGNFIRSKTGNLLLDPPHLHSFNRKNGFKNFYKHFTPRLIKYDRFESMQYRWQHYNKLCFNSDDLFLLKQALDNPSDQLIISQQSDFVPLPLKFEEADFNWPNLVRSDAEKRKRKRKDLRLNKRGFESVDILIPQSLALNIPKGKKTFDSEAFIFSQILNYDKKYLALRNQKASRSWRYYIFYNRIKQEILDKTKLKSDHSLPPFLFTGPLMLEEKGINVCGTCGYGLGYIRKGPYKFYINPVTGLISLYQNSRYENFYGDDETTYFGVFKGHGYYSDKTGIKYFYRDNYDDELWTYIIGEFYLRFPIESRKNPFYWKKEYFMDTKYLKIKKISGPWHDIRESVRDQFKHLYEIDKDIFYDIIEKPKPLKGVKLKFKTKRELKNKDFPNSNFDSY